MSDMLDVASSISTYTTSVDKDTYTGALIGNLSSGSNTLTTEDFYQLMAVQIQNQTIDDTYDTSQFLDQMIQMAVIDAIDTMTTISTTQYAASMVGKEVTVGVTDAVGNVEEVFGEVTATGILNGVQVIFVNDVAYTLSQIMAIGKLPEVSDDTEVEEDDSVDGTEGADGVEGDEEYDGVDGADSDTTVEGTDDTDTDDDSDITVEGTTGTDTDVDDTLDGSEGTTGGVVEDAEYEDVFEEENTGAVEGTDTELDDTLDGSEGTTGGLVDETPDENNDGESTDDSIVEVPATDEA